VYSESLMFDEIMRAPSFISFFAAMTSAGLLALSGARTCANVQVFNLETNQSTVTISGSVVGGAISNQGPGSLTTRIGGSMQVSLTGNTIQFTGQSQIFAETNGNWQPMADGTAGSAPADFGGTASAGFASGVAALRNIQLDVISPTINISGGQFDSTNLTFLFPSNSLSSLAYNVSGLVSKHGSIALIGYATNKVTALGSLTTAGSQQVLTIPVDATFYLKVLSSSDTVIRLHGQLVAVQSAQAPLAVQSVAVQNQSIMIQWQASPGAQFQIQSSTNLGAWRTNTTVVTPASGSYTWTGAVSGPVQFFRLAK
jgi:hypothetical protein